MKYLIAITAFFVLVSCMQDGGSTAADMRYAPSGDGCVRAGCGGSMCVEATEGADLMTTCRMTAEIQCYQSRGTCRRLDSGKCGWAPSYHLQQCLVNPAPYHGAGMGGEGGDGSPAPGIGAPVTSPGISGSVQ